MHKIIACIDGSPSAPAVCDIAAWSSQRLETSVELLHVLEKQEAAATDDLSGSIGLGSREALLEELAELDHRRSRLMLKQGRAMLSGARERLETAGVTDITALQRHDSLVNTLQELEPEMRLLVMGRQGEAHSQEASVIGSHLESVIRTLNRPILVALPEFVPPQRFMLAYDGSATAQRALEMVSRSPLLKGMSCHLVMAGEPTSRRQKALDLAREHLVSAGFRVQASLVGTEVVEQLLDYCAKHDIQLTVMGAYGHSRIREFLVGSITTEMLQKTPTPLLLLR